MSLVLKTVAESSTAPSSSASSSTGKVRATSRSLCLRTSMGRPVAEDSNKMSQHGVLKSGKQVQNRTRVRGDSLPGIHTSSTLTWNDHTSTRYPPPLSHTWKKVYSKMRQKIGRKPGDGIDDLDKNSLIWRMFMSSSLNAAVHLGKNYLENLHSTKNQGDQTMKPLFDASQRLIKAQNEIQ